MDEPTPKQLRYLRALALQTGTSFSPPKTKAQASRAIKQLRQRARSTSYEVAGDREAVWCRRGARDGAGVADEVCGYGSGAHWRGREGS